MKILKVNAKSKVYDIYISYNIVDSILDFIETNIKSDKVGIFTNETIYDIYKDISLFSQINTIFKMRDGEEYKNIETYYSAIDFFIDSSLSRKSCIIAFGGGVVGDIAGFVASTLYRGINLIQVPTTLLSMVDSSVGGKTGINHKLGKNLIGTFYQPDAVFIDLNLLSTLDLKNILNGIGEIIKHYFISGNKILRDIIENNNIVELIKEERKNLLIDLIYNNVKIKSQVVSADEKEKGLRRLLNYGHTFGHVIETAGKYKVVSHGIAVMIGMLMAANYSYKIGKLSSEKRDYHYSIILPYLKYIKIDVSKLKIDFKEFKNIISKDKKAKVGELTLVLLSDLGKYLFYKENNIEKVYNVYIETLDELEEVFK